MIKGVLFDMDGVLVDSEPFICKAAILMFKELGTDVAPEDFHPFVGMGENRYLGGVAEKYGLYVNIEQVKARTYEIYSEIVKNKLQPLPGAKEFISRCQKEGLKMALATSADKVKMEVNLLEIGLAPETFHSILTGEDVVNKKPFPDIYIKAAHSIGLSPEECLVVEDAVSGIRSAKSAGCRSLAVTGSFNAVALDESDWICDSLLSVPNEVLKW
jgi:HAD superfamily hydrolase (TIGR01509 family)